MTKSVRKTRQISSIRNIDDLREEVLLTFERLRDGEVSVSEAGAVAKLSETVISGCKSQMEYSRLTNTPPQIPFLSEAQPEIIHGRSLKLESRSHEDDE